VLCIKPIQIKAVDGRLPCGKCDPCRRQWANQYALRMKHEAAYHEQNSFVTLTYDPDNEPNELLLDDPIKWIKRLRKQIKIRYFLAGEYGETRGRPHYHAILFGTQDPELIEATWGKGYIAVKGVGPDAYRYVANYLQKDQGKAPPAGRRPPFTLKSNGLGRQYAIEHAQQILDQGITVNGQKMTIPRYYLDVIQNAYDYDRESIMYRIHKDQEAALDRTRATVEGIDPETVWQMVQDHPKNKDRDTKRIKQLKQRSNNL